MKNLFKTGLVALVIAVSFSACGGSAPKTGIDTTKKDTVSVDTAKKDTAAKADTTKKDTVKK